MAMMLKNKMHNLGSKLFHRRHFHFDLHLLFPRSVGNAVESAFILPESTYGVENFHKIETPNSSFIGSMEVMAVPKRKVSPHKRGIRNGPKALKPTPVIIRCKACGRVKLPHFYCCSGLREPGGNTC